jgi:preprotein translocase subunit SecE
MFSRITKFLQEVRQELKKVTWPTRQETIKHTMLVVGISLSVAILLGALDYIFVLILNKFVI